MTSRVVQSIRGAIVVAATTLSSSCELFTSPKQSITTFGPTAVAGGLTFTTLVAGEGHTCGLTPAGAAYCWGYNSTRSLTGQGDVPTGQLGDSLTDDELEPVLVAGGRTYVALTAGAYHTCGITSGGVAYCWGANRNEVSASSASPVPTGQLGDGTTEHRFYPVAVAGGLTFTSVTGGYFHTCGLSGGASYCWGSGGLGVGDTVTRLTPTATIGGLAFQRLTSGGTHTCGLTAAGAAYCWGNNAYGQLGDSTTVGKLTPTAVRGGLTFIGLVAGGNNTCGTVASGSVYCWGDNALGAVGDGDAGTNRSMPTKVSTSSSLSGVVIGSLPASVFAGSGHACALTPTGRAMCWGNNNANQIGDGQTLAKTVPTAVATPLTFTSLAAGGLHSCGIVASGAAYCWGNRFVIGTSTP